MRVLHIEDDSTLRKIVDLMLGSEAMSVYGTGLGEEGIDLGKHYDYDAILLDLTLPDMSGYEVFHRLRQAQPQARVILMTAYGYDASHSIVKCRQEGLRYVLFKPFRVDQLLDALEGPAESEMQNAKCGVRMNSP